MLFMLDCDSSHGSLASKSRTFQERHHSPHDYLTACLKSIQGFYANVSKADSDCLETGFKAGYTPEEK